MKPSKNKKSTPDFPRQGTDGAASARLQEPTSRGNWNPGDDLIQALYRRAAALELRWPETSVSDTPGRMVEAVLRHVQKLLDSAQISIQEARDPKRLARLLDFVWTRNAKRDYVRGKSRASRVDVGSLQAMPHAVERVHDKHLMRELLSTLLEGGHRKEVAYSYLLASQGHTCQEISEELEVSERLRVQPSTVRQWKRRAFPALSAQLRKSPGLFSMEVR